MRNTEPMRFRIQELAPLEAAKPEIESRAARGAHALLPGELAHDPDEPGLLWLELAIALRATIGNTNTLTWVRGMEQIGPDLLALAGCAPKIRKDALLEARASLRNLHITDLEDALFRRVFVSAANIVVDHHPVLITRLISLLQTQKDFKAERWSSNELPAYELRIKGGSVEVAVMLDTAVNELTAVELRIYRPDRVYIWRLPPDLSSDLMPHINELIDRRWHL